MKVNLKFLLYMLCFIILTLPRINVPGFDTLIRVMNICKIMAVGIVLILFALRKKKIDKFCWLVIFSFLSLSLSNLLNSMNPKTFLNVFIGNIAIVLLSFLLINDYKKVFLKSYSNYFLVLLVINFITVVYGVFYKTSYSIIYNSYFLGYDNRFIIYIIPTLIGFLKLKKIDPDNEKKYNTKLIFTYVVSILSLYLVFSASALAVMIIMTILYIIFKNSKINFNARTLTIVAFIISFLISFFSFQNYFSFIIEQVLHKSMDLSYRTKIWEYAINKLLNNPLHILYGFGYFNGNNIFIILERLNLGVNHCHNLIINTLFFGGIIWLGIYMKIFSTISSAINKIRDKKEKLFFLCVYFGLLLLLIFDTFEQYTIYYFILYIIYKLNVVGEAK